MNRTTFYRAFLALYPRNFRQQFSDEMIGVFEQGVDERSSRGQDVGAIFVLTELFGLLKGAPRLWIQAMPKKYFVFAVPPISNSIQRPTAEENASSTQELRARFCNSEGSLG